MQGANARAAARGIRFALDFGLKAHPLPLWAPVWPSGAGPEGAQTAMKLQAFVGGLALWAAQVGAQAPTPPPPSAPPPPLSAISALSVERYMGRWYEIAKLPNWFQRNCVSDTSAQYSLLPQGGVQVLNQCRRSNGEMDQALGLAQQQGGPDSAKLKVRFAPAWLSWLPVVWGDYWVVDLDPAYELVAVSEPKREYLWVLSRTPTVEPARYAALLARLSAMGLPVGQLEKTQHTLPR